MENAADALKIAFAVFIFVIAITLTFSLVSQAKSTADVVLYYTDETNFYEYADSSEFNREVSVAEIIPTLYKVYSESVGVEIRIGEKTYPFDLGNREYCVVDGLDDGIIYFNGEGSFNREENLKKFIEELLELEDAKFEEEFVEIPVGGIYEYGPDGTELTKVPGGKKVYITYTNTKKVE